MTRRTVPGRRRTPRDRSGTPWSGLRALTVVLAAVAFGVLCLGLLFVGVVDLPSDAPGDIYDAEAGEAFLAQIEFVQPHAVGVSGGGDTGTYSRHLVFKDPLDPSQVSAPGSYEVDAEPSGRGSTFLLVLTGPSPSGDGWCRATVHEEGDSVTSYPVSVFALCNLTRDAAGS